MENLDVTARLEGDVGTGATVFISHASADRKVANAICSVLESRGLPCWIATRDVPPGENFGEAIVRGIHAARVMVLVFSDDANNSNEIKKEVVLAGRSGIPVIPVRVEDIEPSGAFEYELLTRQWIDLFIGWDQAIDRLVHQIEQVTGHDRAIPAKEAVSPPASIPAGPRPTAPRPERRTMPPGTLRLLALAGLVLAASGIGLVVWWNVGPPAEDGLHPRPASTAVQDQRRDLDAAELNRRGIQAYDQKDYAAAVRWFRTAAEQGDATAQYNLGLLHQNGLGVPQDYQQALSWYRKAADQGKAIAQSNIGLLYQNGWGVPQDYQQALSWYRKAADQGSAIAQSNIGVLYQHGWGVAQDYAQALSWFRKAAEQGNVIAQSTVGYFYQNGWGVERDYGQALIWYRKAADQGDPMAQNNVGALYQHGWGVAQDYQQALSWYRKAADQGNDVAQFNLGVLYQNGLGVAQDSRQARAWMTKAADQGNDAAKDWLASH